MQQSMYIKTELTNRQQFRLFCTPINNSKLAYQIATLLPILLKNGINEKQQVKVAKSLFMNESAYSTPRVKSRPPEEIH